MPNSSKKTPKTLKINGRDAIFHIETGHVYSPHAFPAVALRHAIGVAALEGAGAAGEASNHRKSCDFPLKMSRFEGRNG